MHIRRLGPADGAAYRQLRLLGLLESPSAFGSCHEQEVERPVADFEAALEEGSGRQVFGVFVGTELVGMVAFDREAGRKEQHRAHIRGMVVDPAARGRGIGRDLMGAVMAFAQAQPGLRLVTLSVTAGNRPAIALYERFGFEVFGRLPEALLVDGVFHAEIEMLRRLDAG